MENIYGNDNKLLYYLFAAIGSIYLEIAFRQIWNYFSQAKNY